MRNTLLIGILILSVMAGCSKGSSKDNPANTNNNDLTCTGTKSFALDVSPIFQSICSNSGCHDATSVNGPGPLTTYQ